MELIDDAGPFRESPRCMLAVMRGPQWGDLYCRRLGTRHSSPPLSWQFGLMRFRIVPVLGSEGVIRDTASQHH